MRFCNILDLPEDQQRMLFNAHDQLMEMNGELCLMVGQTVIRCDNDAAGRELLFSLSTGRQIRGEPLNASDQYQRLLCDPLFQPDPEQLRKSRIRSEIRRCVLLTHAPFAATEPLYDSFASIVPFEQEDVPVSIDRNTVALIKNLEKRTDEEVYEYASAVLETLESEGITGNKIGIGRAVTKISELRSSYLDAWKALQTGIRFHAEDQVYQYNQLTLERILETVPESKLKEFRMDFYRNTPGFQMTEELMETVRAFFDNDLNLTATARKLYIHRNTLNYRLDKIKKELGLDLRSFHDAAVFKVISFID